MGRRSDAVQPGEVLHTKMQEMIDRGTTRLIVDIDDVRGYDAQLGRKCALGAWAAQD